MKKLILLFLLIPGFLFGQRVNEHKIQQTITAATNYKNKIIADNGTIRSDHLVKAFYYQNIEASTLNSIEFAWFGEASTKLRTSTIYNYVTKIHSLIGSNDAVQTTANNQPRLTGNIAPNDMLSLYVQSGESRSLTHPDITVSGTYTVTRCEATETTGKTTVTHTELTSGTLNTITPSGRLYAYIIRNKALTANEKALESAFLLSIYPEIPSVTIGTQTWALRNCDMVATPMGNVIANITEGTNVEKVTNGGFTGNANGWGLESGWSYGTNNLVASSVTTGLVYQANVLTINKWYKLQFDCVVSSGRVGVYLDGGTYVGLMITTGTSIAYFYNTNSSTYIYFRSPDNNFSGSIDNVSIQEVGWADSQNLYDYVYANTAGTAEQKTYAAVKAAAMWCFWNNSADNGAIYGKLYNWFAVALLQEDITAYNAANPLTPWGWHVPTSTEFTTLANALGGTSVAGGKMKTDDLNYFSVIGTNESKFSGIATGIRYNGSFSEINNYIIFRSQTDITMELYIDNLLRISTIMNNTGCSIRLIKD